MNNQLPNFLIVGTAKAATTTIHEYLKQHPDIFMTEWKEPSFFVFKDREEPIYTTDRPIKFVTNIDDYKALFKEGELNKIKGESSTPYLYFYEKTIKNIKEVYDNYENIKILIVLRNPVDRAYSQYMMKVRDLVENLSFEEAIEAEEHRMDTNAHFDFFYRDRGLYYNQVKAYKKEFKHVKIMFYDDFRKDEERFLNEIVLFLELENAKFNRIGKQNISGRPKIKALSSLMKDNPLKRAFSYLLNQKVKLEIKNFIMRKNLKREKLNEETRIKLKKFYRGDIENLENLIKIDLKKWKE